MKTLTAEEEKNVKITCYRSNIYIIHCIVCWNNLPSLLISNTFFERNYTYYVFFQILLNLLIYVKCLDSFVWKSLFICSCLLSVLMHFLPGSTYNNPGIFSVITIMQDNLTNTKSTGEHKNLNFLLINVKLHCIPSIMISHHLCTYCQITFLSSMWLSMDLSDFA